jgi:hypothetical protein
LDVLKDKDRGAERRRERGRHKQNWYSEIKIERNIYSLKHSFKEKTTRQAEEQRKRVIDIHSIDMSHIDTEKHRYRETWIRRKIDTEKQTEKHKQIDINTEIQRHTDTEKNSYRKTETYINRNIDTEKHRYRET